MKRYHEISGEALEKKLRYYKMSPPPPATSGEVLNPTTQRKAGDFFWLRDKITYDHTKKGHERRGLVGSSGGV
jgi:hypothetical protein